MNKLIAWVGAVVMVLGSGCLETSTYVKVKKDGHGAILLRAYVNTNAIANIAGGAANMMGDMMGGVMGEAMGEMVGGMAQTVGGDAATAGELKEKMRAEIKQNMSEGIAKSETQIEMTMEGPETVYDETKARKLAKAFGENVRFLKGKDITHADRRKGFEVYYEFDDISQIVVGPGICDVIVNMSDSDGGTEIDTMYEGYRFAMQKGPSATLSIKPPPSEAEMDKEWMATATPEEIAEYKAESLAEDDDSDIKDDDDAAGEMDAQMQEQMLGAFKGRKDQIVIAVDGTVIASNASYRSRKQPNTVVLVNVDYEKMLSHPKGKELLKNDGIETVEFIRQLREAKIPGCIVEDPTKTVTITFN